MGVFVVFLVVVGEGRVIFFFGFRVLVCVEGTLVKCFFFRRVVRV